MEDTPKAPVASALAWGEGTPSINPQVNQIPENPPEDAPLTFGVQTPFVDTQSINPMDDLSTGKMMAVDKAAQDKKAFLEMSARDKKAMLGMAYLSDPNNMTSDILANQMDSDQISQMGRDFATKDRLTLSQEYGSEVADNAWRFGAARQGIRQTQNEKRDTGTAIADAAINVFDGGVTGILSASGLALNAFGPDAAARGAKGQRIINETIKGWTSELAQQREALGNVQDTITDGENQKIREQELADGASPFEAGVKYISRNLYSEIDNIISDPIRLANLGSNSIGNLASTLLTTGGLLKATGFAANSKAARYIYAGVEGAMEGGDAYQQTSTSITDMTFKELEEGSEAYNKYRAAGYTPEEARNRVAQDGAIIAAATVAPMALLMSRTSAKFEMSLLSGLDHKSIVGALSETGKAGVAQFIEETGQEANSQFVSNALVKALADPNQDLAKGVGEAGAQGGLGGLAMAGFTNATHVPAALHGEAVERLTGLATDMAARAKEKNNPASPVRTQEAVKVAAEAAPVVADFVNTATPTQFPDGKDIAAKEGYEGHAGVAKYNGSNFIPAINRLTTITDVEADNMPLGLKKLITKEDGTRYSKPEALYRMTVALKNKTLGGNDQSFAQVYLKNETEYANDAFAHGLDDYVQNIDNPDFASTMNSVFEAHEKIFASTANQNNSEDVTSNKIKPAPVVEITDDNVDTQEVKSSVEHAVLVAEHNPLAVNIDQAESIISQYRKGNFQNISPERIQALEASAKVAKIIQAANVARAEARAKLSTDPKTAPKVVPLDDPTTENSGNVRTSIREGLHLKNKMNGILPYAGVIAQAVKNGNIDDARSYMEMVRDFAKGMINKHQAFVLSETTGKKEIYAHNTPLGWFSKDNPKNTQGMILHKDNKNSRLFMENVRIDAEAVTEFYNEMLRVYPELAENHSPLSLTDTLKDQAAAADLEDNAKTPKAPKTEEQKKSEAATKRLDKRTEKELENPVMARAAEQLKETGSTLHAMPRAMKTKVRQMMRAVEAELGYNITGLVSNFMVIRGTDPTLAAVYYDVGESNTISLVISEELMNPDAILPPFASSPEEFLAAVLAHDMGHIIDYNHLNNTGKLASDSRQLDEEGVLETDGLVFEEVQKAINDPEDDTVKAIMHNSESYEKGTEEYRKELFADIAMLMLTNPQFMRENLPHAAAFFEELAAVALPVGKAKQAAEERAKAKAIRDAARIAAAAAKPPVKRRVRKGVSEGDETPTLTETEQAIKDLYKQLKKAVKFPLLRMIIGKAGVDPKGVLGQELRARGFDTKTNPGLFRTNGVKDIDNIVVSENPDLIGLVAEGENGYFDTDALTTAIIDELNGNGIEIPNNLSKSQIEARIAELDKERNDADAAKAEAEREESLRVFLNNESRTKIKNGVIDAEVEHTILPVHQKAYIKHLITIMSDDLPFDVNQFVGYMFGVNVLNGIIGGYVAENIVDNNHILVVNNAHLDRSDELFVELIFHEMGHVLDHRMENASNDAVFHSKGDEYYPPKISLEDPITAEEDGDVITEIKFAIANDSWFKDYFSYAMAYADPTRQRMELFAELVRLYHSNPKLMEADAWFPKFAAFYEDQIQQLAEKPYVELNQAGEAARRSAAEAAEREAIEAAEEARLEAERLEAERLAAEAAAAAANKTRIVKLGPTEVNPDVVNTMRVQGKDASNTKIGEPGWLGNPFKVSPAYYHKQASYLYGKLMVMKMASSKEYFEAIKALADKKLGYYKPELDVSHAKILDELVTLVADKTFEEFNPIGLKFMAQMDKNLEEFATPNEELVTGGVNLPLLGNAQDKYRPKDQAKADKATKFIGRGTAKSSTNLYGELFGKRANPKKFVKEDVVFTSTEGNRGGRLRFDPDIYLKAIVAGVTFITDIFDDRDTSFNVGEQELATFLQNNGYEESQPGTWTPKINHTEVTETPPAEVTPRVRPPKQTMAERFSSLVQWLGRNRFLQAYRNEPDKSNFAALKAPLQDLWDMLHLDDVNDIKNMKKALLELGFKQHTLDSLIAKDADAIKSVFKMADMLGDTMNENLDIGINKNRLKTETKNFLQMIAEGKDVTRFKNGRVLSLAVPVTMDDGSIVYRYHPQIVQIAALAVTQWVMDARFTPDVTLESSDIARIFQVDEELMTAGQEAEFRKALASGVSPQNAIREIAQMIETMLGVQSNQDVISGDAGGIILGLAAEALSAATKPHGKSGTQFVVIEDTNAIKDKAGNFIFTEMHAAKRRYTWVNFKNDPMDRGRKAMKKLPNFLTRLNDPEAIVDRIIGAPPKYINPTQLRNKTADLSRLERNTIKNSQDIGYRINQPYVGWMKNMGKENYLNLLRSTFGGVYTPDLDETNYNINDFESRKGNNVGFSMGWDKTMEYVEDMEQYATFANMEQNDVKAYWTYRITKVGRPMMEGFGPQNDKTAREALTTTNAVIKLDSRYDMNTFWMTIGQSLGLKTEKMWRSEIVKEASSVLDPESKMGKKYLPLLAVMDDPVAFMAAAKGAKFTDKELHALVSLDIMLKAKEAGATSFEHSLAFEADGKTDGPINSLVNATIGFFTDAQFGFMEMGGLFIRKPRKTDEEGNSLGKTLADFWHEKDKDGKLRGTDLYIFGADDLKQRINNQMEGRQDKLNTNQPSKGDMLNMRNAKIILRLINMTGNVTFDPGTGNITILTRNALKNPLTISVYGSGMKGISRKIVGEFLDVYYGLMSELHQARQANADFSLTLGDLYPEYGYDGPFGHESDTPAGKASLEDDLHQIMNWVTIKPPRSQNEFTVRPQIKGTKEARPEVWMDYTQANKTTIPLEGYNTLVANMQHFFVAPMNASINEIMGGTIDVMKTMNNATNIQSIGAMALYKQETAKLIEKRIAEGVMQKGDYLSQKDMLSLVQMANNIGPLIETKDQTFNLGVKESAENNNEVVEMINGSQTSSLNEPQPSQAKAKFAPFFNIGSGDAYMNLVLYGANGEEMKDSLGVYDGVEMSANNIDRQSAVINKAVHNGWTNNSMQAVVDSFKNFVQNFDLNLLSAADIEMISKMFPHMELDQGTVIEALEDEFKTMLKQMQHISNSVEARKRTLNQVTHSVDHMAGAEQAYLHEGIDLTDGNEAHEMNELYRKNLDDVVRERNTPREKAIVEDGAFKEDILKFGQRIGRTLVVLPITTLAAVMKTHLKRGDDKQIMTQAAKALANAGFEFVYGTEKDLTKWRDERYGKQSQAIENGYIDNINKVVYVSNIVTSTMLHELVHAATLNIMEEVMRTPEKAKPEAIDAVERLNILMKQFMDNKIITFHTGEFEAATSLRDTLQTIFDDANLDPVTGNIKALNEFMAYVLTNQDLKSYLKGTRVRDSFVQLSRKVVILMKRLLGIQAHVGNDMFSNIKFNTQVLMAYNAEATTTSALRLNQTVLGHDARLTLVLKKFQDMLAGFSARGLAEQNSAAGAVMDAKANANMFSNVAFNWNGAEINTFAAIQAAMATTLKLNSNALLGAQEIYLHALKHLKDGAVFITDPTDPNQKVMADAKFNLITGAYGQVIDKQDRSNLLSSFLALSQVDDNFREILDAMPKMKTKLKLQNSFANTVTNLYETIMQTLVGLIFKGRDLDAGIVKNLDALALSLTDIEKDSSHRLDMIIQSKLNQGSDYVAGLLQKGYDKAFEKADAFQSSSKILNAAALTTSLVTGTLSKKYSTKLADEITGELNDENASKILRKLVNEIRGMTTDNAAVVKMIGIVKYAVSSARQDFRENVPNLIASKFSKRFKNAEWSKVYRTIGKTDIPALVQQGYSVTEIGKLLADQSYMNTQIAKLEGDIRKLNPNKAARYIVKAKELSVYMMNHDLKSMNFNRNAEAIVRLLGETDMDMNTPDPMLTKAIDALATLYAVEWTEQSDRAFTSDLFKNEAKGMEFMVKYMNSRAIAEKQKGGEIALYNHFKGRLDTNIQDEGSLILRPESQAAKLATLSYKKVGDYKNQPFDKHKLAYFYSPVSGQATYNQGVMQTVRPQMHGVDINNGLTINGHTGGLIGYKRAQIIHHRILRNPTTSMGRAGTYFMPVFSGSGDVVGYERPMEGGMIEKFVQRDENMAAILGAWRGRQAEEELSEKFNEALADALYAMWKNATVEEQSQYENIALSPNKTVADAWDKMPERMKEYVQNHFGEDTFMVKRNMVDDAVGYRSASIGDAFTGNTEMPKPLMDAIQTVALAAFGSDAYRYLVNTESIIQTIVSSAKLTIVVKSGVVMVGNIISNVFHLSMLRGVPITDWAKAPAKIMETNRFLKNKVRKSQIEAELASTNNTQTIATLKSELKSLDDSDKRMSIWPLIEAGEFNTISDGLTEADQALATNKWVKYIEDKFDNLPEGARTVVQNALVTRDTQLFKLLNRGVQYGDFIAKSIYYDHLTKKGKTHDEIIMVLKDEFVDYNRLPGRVRSYAESMGLTWFFAFKIRAMKVSLAVIRDNPLKALWASAMPMHLPLFGSVDTVLNSNIIAGFFNGKLPYSIGPSMVWQLFGLNPAVNLLT